MLRDQTKGEIAFYSASILFAITVVFIKLTANHFGGIFVSSVRFIIALMLGLIIIRIRKIPFRIIDIKSWVLRGVLGSSAMLIFFSSIQLSSSGRITLIFNTFPVFVAIFGFLFFRQKITITNIISLILCLSGIIIIFYDGSKYPLKGDLLGLSAAILAGITVHYVKKSSEKNNPIIVYFAACFFGLLYTPLGIKDIYNVNFQNIIPLLGVAVFSFAAQVSMTYGYRHISAAKGSIISYSAIPLTILFSHFIGEQFKPLFFIGMIPITIGLLINKLK